MHLGDIPTSAAAVAVLAAANVQIRTEPEPLEELGERVTAPIEPEDLLEAVATDSAGTEVVTIDPVPDGHPSGFERAWLDHREAAREQERKDLEALNETLYRGHGTDPATITGLAPPVPVKGK